MKLSIASIGAVLCFSTQGFAVAVSATVADCAIDTYYCTSSAQDVGIMTIEDIVHGGGYGNGDQAKYLFQCQRENAGRGYYNGVMRFARYCDNGCVVDKRENWYSDYCDLTPQQDNSRVSVTWSPKEKVELLY